MSKREKLRKALHKAPKPQLHFHLDGSLSFDFIQQSIQRSKDRYTEPKVFFEKDWEPQNNIELRHWLMKLKEHQIAGGSVMNKNSNWRVFDICNQFLQTADDLFLIAFELVTSMYDQHGVNYLEVRFAPVLHTFGSLTEYESVEAVVLGFRRAVNDLKQKGIEVGGGILLCALRSYPIEKAFQTVDLCTHFDDVVGFDIAGDEGTFPLSLFKDVLTYAKSKSVSVTVHAGEWNERKNPKIIENIRNAIECSVDRIGHGLALRSCDPQILRDLIDENISVEVCLTANCGNPQKCRSLGEHPLPILLSKGVKIAAMNVDNLLLSGNLDIGAPNPTGECVRALLDCELTPQLFQIIYNGYKAGFACHKESIIETSLKQWQEIYLPQIESILSENSDK